jgi:transcriptional regulator with XRE-family HTH domain
VSADMQELQTAIQRAEAAGISRAQIADAFEVSVGQVDRYLSGASEPHRIMFRVFGDALAKLMAAHESASAKGS